LALPFAEIGNEVLANLNRPMLPGKDRQSKVRLVEVGASKLRPAKVRRDKCGPPETNNR
jgi:hypothetical protein